MTSEAATKTFFCVFCKEVSSLSLDGTFQNHMEFVHNFFFEYHLFYHPVDQTLTCIIHKISLDKNTIFKTSGLQLHRRNNDIQPFRAYFSRNFVCQQFEQILSCLIKINSDNSYKSLSNLIHFHIVLYLKNSMKA